ncbi:hypothetical protein B0T25DRAFT_145414 [Lasiosphaeria hispida]|uniref:Uncharacterized protein n=1 Tax=Lasiosphaeria hispida TaxID=260671 RepID=A0AAJ0HLF1_9PEZI|nr:hypothetical protein B0T25DRAFT_145414 [Lasiosphaeria hispida]
MTQLIIGIDLEYRQNKGKEASIIVWRPEDVEKDGEMLLKAVETEEGGIFRAVDGSLANGDKILRIGLKDFGNRYDCPGIDNISGEITVSFSQLYDIVQESDIIEERRDGEQANSGYPTRKYWKRDRTPPERLSSLDRKRFKAEKEEVNKRLND